MLPLTACAVTAAPRLVGPQPQHACRIRVPGRCHAGASTLPHEHSDHVPVTLFTRDVTLPCGSAVRLVLPEDPYAVEALHRLEGDHTADAVWAECWPSAFACADALLCGSTPILAGLRQQPVRRVCELGAGVGLAGLAAALSWPTASVLLTDREPRALWCALASAQANGLRVDASGLPPSLPSLPDAGAGDPNSPSVSAALLDWDAPLHPSLRGAFDVLLLCDVLYQPGSIGLLATLVPQLLAPDGVILLADTAHRPGKEGLRRQFLDGVASATAGGRVMRVQAAHTLVAHMPAPTLDVNTGDSHAVELVVLST